MRENEGSEMFMLNSSAIQEYGSNGLHSRDKSPSVKERHTQTASATDASLRLDQSSKSYANLLKVWLS